MRERRKLQRFDLALASRVDVLDATQEKMKDPNHFLTRDVSPGGAFLSTSRPLSTGSRVRVDMVLRPDGTSGTSGYGKMQAVGYVVR